MKVFSEYMQYASVFSNISLADGLVFSAQLLCVRRNRYPYTKEDIPDQYDARVPQGAFKNNHKRTKMI